MVVKYLGDISERITNFYIILIDYFARGVSLKCLFIRLKTFPYIGIREFAKRWVKPDNMSTPFFIIFCLLYYSHLYYSLFYDFLNIYPY